MWSPNHFSTSSCFPRFSGSRFFRVQVFQGPGFSGSGFRSSPKIIHNLNTTKPQSHDMPSIRMIKLCGNSICKPLSIIFNDCLKEGKFPSDWKKAHVVPVHRKGDKQCLERYRPIYLLPICSKFLILSFIMTYSPFLLIINWFLLTSQDLDLVTPVLTNYLLLLMKYISRWITDLK